MASKKTTAGLTSEIANVMGKSQREQSYRALSQRKADLEALSKKAEGFGIATRDIDRAILETASAIDTIVGQGDLFPATPIEEEAAG